jgi:hypothetical protein
MYRSGSKAILSVAGLTLAVATGCSSGPTYETTETATAQTDTGGPLNIHGNLARDGAGNNAIHVFVNGQKVIDGPLDELYTGSNSGTYGNRDIRSDCSTKRLNLHDFRVTCEIFVDGKPETTLGF